MVSKVHVTIVAGVVGIISLVCAVVALGLVISNGGDTTSAIAVVSPFIAIVTACVGVIGGVAVPTNP